MRIPAIETCKLSDLQDKTAKEMLEAIDFELSQMFWGSEYNLEWTASDRIQHCKTVLEAAIAKLPLIITD